MVPFFKPILINRIRRVINLKGRIRKIKKSKQIRRFSWRQHILMKKKQLIEKNKKLEENRLVKDHSSEFASIRSSQEGAVYSRQSSLADDDDDLDYDSVSNKGFDTGAEELANTSVSALRAQRESNDDEEPPNYDQC